MVRDHRIDPAQRLDLLRIQTRGDMVVLHGLHGLFWCQGLVSSIYYCLGSHFLMTSISFSAWIGLLQ